MLKLTGAMLLKSHTTLKNDLTDGLSLDYTLHLAGAVTQHSYWVAHLAADLGWIDLAQFCLG